MRSRRSGRPRPSSTAPLSRTERRAALSRRRARVALAAAAAFAAIVLVTSLPVDTLLHQRSQTAATAATVEHLATSNRALAGQVAALTDPPTVRSLAHRDLGYVEPGQKSYVVVAPASSAGAGSGSAGAGGTASASVGHEQLDQPVALPGTAASARDIGIAAAAGSTASAGATAAAPASPTGNAGSGGFLSRMLHSLEFWS